MGASATLPTMMTLAALRDAVQQAEVADITKVNNDDLQYAVIAVYVALGYEKEEALLVYNHSCNRVGEQINRVVEESISGR